MDDPVRAIMIAGKNIQSVLLKLPGSGLILPHWSLGLFNKAQSHRM